MGTAPRSLKPVVCPISQNCTDLYGGNRMGQILYLPIDSPAQYHGELAFSSKFHCFLPCKLSNPKTEKNYQVYTGPPLKVLPSVDAMEPSDLGKM